MAFCKNCGTQLNDNENFCSSCGTKTDKSENNADGSQINNESLQGQNNTYAGNNQNENSQNNYNQNNYQRNNFTNNFDQNDIQRTKYLSIFAYLSMLMIIPILLEPNSKFVRFHVNQGLTLLISFFIGGIVMIVPIIGWFIAGPIWLIFNIVCLVMGIVHAYKGEAKELPIIGKFRILRD